MKNIVFWVWAIGCILLLHSCTTQQHATTIERDKNEGCTVHLIMQIGIDGTDSDVVEVRGQLEPCFERTCVIPCKDNPSQGCKVISHVIVKKWSDIPERDQNAFHHINMVPQDQLPSFVNAIGTPNGDATGGTWRRHAYPRTYCHEVLHLAGLPDQYCSRLWDSVNNKAVVEISCKPAGSDPDAGKCCDPRPMIPHRCSTPCTGHESDLMATLEPEISCDNILDAIKKAGFDNCPEACCKDPHRTVGVPRAECSVNIYMGYGLLKTKDDYNALSIDKTNYGGYNIGAGVSGSYNITPNLDVTAGLRVIDATQATHKADVGGVKVKSGYRFLQTGVDLGAAYRALPNIKAFGGLGFGFDLSAKNGSSAGNKIDYKKIENVKKNVAVSLLLGAMYSNNHSTGLGGRIKPFACIRLPFNSMLKVNHFKNDLFTFDAGVSFDIGSLNMGK